MLLLFLILSRVLKCYFLTDVIEGTSWTTNGWTKDNSNTFSSTQNCDQSTIGPFFGSIQQNIKKQYQLYPHYSLEISIDFLYTSYWSGILNYAQIYLDSQQIYYASDISSLDFTSPQDYCTINLQFIFTYSQQLLTINKIISHNQNNVVLKIQSSFNCNILSLFTLCEQVMIKNIIIFVKECHFSCLTCTGSLKTQCLTCPNGIPNSNGQCQCNTGLNAYNYTCISSCPQYYQADINNYCILQCSNNCQLCDQDICIQCETNYYTYLGKCVSQCPKNSIIQSNVCQDYSEISTYGSIYLGQYFVNLNESISEQINQFTFSGTSQTGQLYSIYQNQILLGGFGVWSQGNFQITFSSLPSHNKLRLYFDAWFIDNWSNKQFIVTLDGSQIYSQTYSSSSSLSNLFYQSNNDKIQTISLLIDHLLNTATISFQINLGQSSYDGSLALCNIFILVDQCDNNCDQCSSTICTTCVSGYSLINNKCGLCDISNFRQNDCTCINGYYDDNVNLNCFQCRLECETCSDYDTCITCKIGTFLIITPYCMNCEDGYYYSSSQCQKCDQACLTCFGPLSNNCIACKTQELLNENNECYSCQQNQFINSNYQCQDCLIKCDTCENSYQCSTCVSDRTNPPNCECYPGYFENSESICQPCNYQCSTCQQLSNFCTSCSGNRSSLPNCNCPQNSIETEGNIWCSDCSTMVMNIQFNNDLTKLILSFEKEINKIISECSYIFKTSTLLTFGTNPQCFVKSKTINVILGQNPTLNYGNIIYLKSEIIKSVDCDTFISTYVNNFIIQDSMPIPSISFSKSIIELNDCIDQEGSTSILQTNNSGNSQLIINSWNLYSSNFQDNQTSLFLQEINTRLTTSTTIFTFPNTILTQGNELILQIDYQNFLDIPGNTLIKIVQSQNDLILIPILQESSFYISQPISALFYLKTCNSDNTQSVYNIKLTISSIISEDEIYINDSYYYYLDSNLLNAQIYNLFVEILYDDEQILNLTQTLNIIEDENQLILSSGGEILGYKQEIKVTATFTQDSSELSNLEWECFNINEDQSCEYDDEELAFSQGDQIIIPPNTFEPFTIISISASVNDIKETLLIIVQETDTPKVEYITTPDVTTGYINYYDQLIFEFTYSDINANPDTLIYVGMLTNENDLMKIFKFDYLELKVQLWDYFEITELTNSITLKVNIYNIEYFLPTTVSIPININIPPSECIIMLDNKYGEAINTEFYISINSCVDLNQPLEYNLYLYLSQEDIHYDYLKGQVHKGYLLYDFSIQNEFNTILVGNGTIYLMTQVKDSLNGINNFTQSINITQPSQYNLDIENAELLELLLYLINFKYLSSTNYEQYLESIQNKLIYYENCECNSNTKLILQAKTLLLPLLSQNRSQLNIELNSSQIRLQEIQDNFNELEYYNYKLYNYTTKEFKKLQLYIETIKLIQYISSLFELNNIDQLNYSRLLNEEDIDIANQNNNLTLQSALIVSNIQMKQQVINGQESIIETNQFNIATLKATNKILQQQLGNILDQSYENETFQYRIINYTQNPYKYDSRFMAISDNTSNYSVYSPSLKTLSSSNSNDTTIELTTNLNYTFNSSNSIVECVQQDQSLEWDSGSCTQTTSDGSTTCSCSSVNVVTITNAFEEIGSEFVGFFTYDTLLAIYHYNFIPIIFTYIMILYTTLFIWFLCYGYRMDQKELLQNTQQNPKITPSEWDEIVEKPKIIAHIGQIENDQRLTLDSQISHIRMINSKKISSIESQQTQMEENLRIKTPQTIPSMKVIQIKRNLAVQTNLCSERISEDAELNKYHNTKTETNEIQNEQNSARSEQDNHPSNLNSLIARMKNQTLSTFKSILYFYEINHKIISLYCLYDKNYSRVYRTIIVYISMIGQIGIYTFFGQVIDINTIIALSILQTFFGFLYRKLMSCFLNTQNQILNYIGFNLGFISAIFFLFLTLGSIAKKYTNTKQATLWGLAYFGSLAIEHFCYYIFMYFTLFVVIKRFGEYQCIQKTMKYLLNEKVYIEVFTKQ